MADRLFTTSKTDEILNALRYETKLEKSTLARIAFVLSLTRDGADVKSYADFGGSEMKRPTFIGSDEWQFDTHTIYKWQSFTLVINGPTFLQELMIKCETYEL